MEKEPTREKKPKKYRLIRRAGAATDEIDFESRPEAQQFLSEDEESPENEVVWTGNEMELLQGGIWGEADIVPSEEDMYELQEWDDDDWRFVGLFRTEEDMEESLADMEDPSKTADGETIH